MSNAYSIRSSHFITGSIFGLSLLRDAPSEQRKESIDFHVQADDYFATLATILGLIADLDDTSSVKRRLIDLRDELVFLQQKYRIGRK